MPPPEKYRVAVIGHTGKGNYGHGLDTVWLNHPRAEIVAVADEDEAGRTAAVKRLSAKTGYADYREMLAKEKPQIVSVAARFPDCHRDMTIACAEHGASIFLEKPVSRTLQEADEMVAACEKHHVKCAIAHQTVYAPRVKAVKQLIADGKIGEVVELHGHGKCDKRGGGEDMMVLGTHTFDLMRFLFGECRWCFSRISVNGKQPLAADLRQAGENIGPIIGDHIAATFGFDAKGGPPVVAHYTTFVAKAGAGQRYWLEIRGTKGLIHLGFGISPVALLCEDPAWMPGKSKAAWQPISSEGLGKPDAPLPPNVANGNIFIVNDLIQAIEQDREPLDSIKDGRASLEMILAVYESFRLDKPVDLPLKTRKHPLSLL